MGLDQFLYKHTFVWGEEDQAKIKVDLPGVKVERIRYIIEEVGYWRKANAIHKWFVENVQNNVDDCKEYYVSKENLAMLLGLAKKVKADPKKANSLLPTTQGFFFGSMEYAEWYMEDIEKTIKILEDVLAESDADDIYYRSSW